MHNRYTITASREKIEERFGIDATEGYRPKYNCAPTHVLPIITNRSSQGFSFFYWGLIPSMANGKSVSTKLINTKSHTILQKKPLLESLRYKRCIIPADGFYVWKNISKKRRVPHYFTFEDRRLFGIAGFWEEYEDFDGGVKHSFTMVTTEPNPSLSDFEDDMPAILKAEHEKPWLVDSQGERRLYEMIQTTPDDEFTSFSVSPSIENIDIDRPGLITPTPPADQLGNYTLFN